MDKKVHNVSRLDATSDFLQMEVDGEIYQIPWETCSPLLARASMSERRHMEV